MGKNSREAEVQKERESKVLYEIYGKNDIPPSPAEPLQGEVDYNDSDVPIIPFEEVVVPDPYPPQPPPSQMMPPPMMGPMGGMFPPPPQQQPQQPSPAAGLDLSSLSSLLQQDPSMLSKLLDLSTLQGLTQTPSPALGGVGVGGGPAGPYNYGGQQPPPAAYPNQYAHTLHNNHHNNSRLPPTTCTIHCSRPCRIQALTLMIQR